MITDIHSIEGIGLPHLERRMKIIKSAAGAQMLCMGDDAIKANRGHRLQQGRLLEAISRQVES